MSNFPVRGVRGEEPHAVAEAVKYLRKGWRRPMQTLVRLDNGKVVLGRRCDAGRLSPPAKQIQQRQQPPMVIPLDNAGIPDAEVRQQIGEGLFRSGRVSILTMNLAPGFRPEDTGEAMPGVEFEPWYIDPYAVASYDPARPDEVIDRDPAAGHVCFVCGARGVGYLRTYIDPSTFEGVAKLFAPHAGSVRLTADVMPRAGGGQIAAVKVGSCADHIGQLEALLYTAGSFGVINPQIIAAARGF